MIVCQGWLTIHDVIVFLFTRTLYLHLRHDSLKMVLRPLFALALCYRTKTKCNTCGHIVFSLLHILELSIFNLCVYEFYPGTSP